jgi:hypothetical protein
MAEKKSKLVEIKTKPTTSSVEDYINKIQDEQKRNDSFALVDMMKKATSEEPVLWSSSIIGFGDVIIRSPQTGREVNWLKIGFAPRKANLSLYLNMDIRQRTEELKMLGKHKTGAGCLYINKLEDVDVKVLEELINTSMMQYNS